MQPSQYDPQYVNNIIHCSVLRMCHRTEPPLWARIKASVFCESSSRPICSIFWPTWFTSCTKVSIIYRRHQRELTHIRTHVLIPIWLFALDLLQERWVNEIRSDGSYLPRGRPWEWSYCLHKQSMMINEGTEVGDKNNVRFYEWKDAVWQGIREVPKGPVGVNHMDREGK